MKQRTLTHATSMKAKSALCNEWLLVASSAELGARSLARHVLGHPLLLSRDQPSKVRALGATSGLLYPTHEADGFVWVCLASSPRCQAPPAWPGDERYRKTSVITDVRAELDQVLANFVDCGHTGFVHAGLFRRPPSKPVRAVIEERPTGVLIETFGEGDPRSLLSKLLLHPGETVRHTDEYQAPCTVRVDYHFGAERHLVTTSVCTPEEEGRTRIYTQLALRWPFWSRAAMLPLRLLTLRILEQDRLILEAQHRTMLQLGRRFTSTDADAPTVWVERALGLHEAGGSFTQGPRRTEVTYRL